MKRLIVHMTLLGAFCSAMAQEQDSSVRQLREATVRDFHKTPLDQGKLILFLPSNELQNTLSQNLEMSSPVLIKSYGAGMLGSVSIRGTGASHTPLLWHGISIQNAQNGQQDLSLLNGFLFDRISLSTGAQNNLSTGGILGGRISLDQAPISKGHTLRAGIGLGSFGTRQMQLAYDYEGKQISNRFRVYHTEAENDFGYYNRLQQNRHQQMVHAYTQSMNVLEDFNYRINSKWDAGLAFWWQEGNRQIPPTFVAESRESQQDLSARILAHATYTDSVQLFSVSSAFFADHNYYQDPDSRLHSANHGFTQTHQLRYRRKLKLLSLEGGAVYQGLEGKSGSYPGGVKKEERYALYLALFGESNPAGLFKWKADIRQQLWQNDPLLPSASLGMDWEFRKQRFLHLHLTRIVRLPNLNDLYWNPGGNPELQPEQGYSGELGYSLARSFGRHLLRFRAQAYYSLIDHWIIWLPENGYWTPQNLRQVHSRGVEWEFGYLHLNGKKQLQLRYGGSFTRSSNEKPAGPADNSVGNQLIYVPYWKNYVSLEWKVKRFSAAYGHSFTGGRYISSDNLEFLPAYSLGNLNLEYSFRLKNQYIRVGAGIRNVWDTRYESIVLRPMPGRYFQINLNYQLYRK